MFALPWKSPAPFAVGTFAQRRTLGQNGVLEERLKVVREELDELQSTLELIPLELQESLLAEVGVRWNSCENAYQGAKAAPDEEGVAVAEDCVTRLKKAIQEAMALLTAPPQTEDIAISEPEPEEEPRGASESDVTQIAAIAGVSVFVAVLLYALSS